MSCVAKCLCAIMCLQVVLCQIEECKTLVGSIGSCVSITKCEPLLRVMPQARTNTAIRQVLKRSLCGYIDDKPKVCCPILPKPAPLPSTTIQSVFTTTQPPISLINQSTVQSSTQPSTTLKAPSKPSHYITAFPEPPVCGLSNATFGRIVDGINATLGDFPWIAALGYRGRRGLPMGWLCGGSLISPRHTLTAAHCIHNYEEDLFLVRLGELDLERDDDGARPLDVLIKTQIKHEEYSPTSYANDIGILVLEKDVEFTDFIHPICIPAASALRGRDYVDYSPTVAGWGQTEFRGPKAQHLQLAQLPVVSNEACAQAYAPYKTQIEIDSRMLCAGYQSGGRDTCQGDSGGPLMQPIWNPTIFKSYVYQIGVVSFGRRCADAGFPGVYSRVTSYVPWLQKVVLGVGSS